jgi:transposase
MKLKEQDLRDIGKLVDQGWTYIKIADKISMNRSYIQALVKRYKLHGIDAILHSQAKTFTIDEKIAIINRYYSGESKISLATEINVNCAVVYSWIKKHEQLGYNGLIDNRGGPGRTKMRRPKKNTALTQNASTTENQAPLTDSEREELNELRKKLYYQQMEIDCLKKIQALVQERQNRQTKKKQ